MRPVSKLNAVVFLTMGMFMRALPELKPGWFPPSDNGGGNGTALWLYAMGTITAVIGIHYLIKTGAVSLVWRWVSFKAAQIRTENRTIPAPSSRPDQDLSASSQNQGWLA